MTASAWRPASTLSAIKRRARLYADIRSFFASHEVLEVEVPLLAATGVTDLHIENPRVVSGDETSCLQSSPEYFLKRLLAAYPQAYYYLGKAFREGESGSRHHREFTLLEWYRPAWDEYQLINEVHTLLETVGIEAGGNIKKITYQDVFKSTTGVDPLEATDAELRDFACCVSHSVWEDCDRATSLDLIFSLCVESELPEGLVFITEYPACQAALAKLDKDKSGNVIARRFEAFINGMEVANGYWELCDADEQRQRFDADNQARAARGKRPMPIDESLMAALEQGLPDCAGVAIGLDRVLMQLLGVEQIAEVLSFCERRGE